MTPIWNKSATPPTPPPGRTVRARCPKPDCIHKKGESLAVTADADGCGLVWVCHRCGWSGAERNQRRTEREPIRSTQAPRQNRNLDRAREIWRQTRPAGNSLTHLWLSGRGIRFAIPAAIRHHDSLPYYDDGHARRWPAMLVRMDGAAGEMVGIHRTWLDGSILLDEVAKAPIPTPRKVLGQMGVAWLGPRHAEAIVVGEGVESTLAAAELGRNALPAWRGCAERDGGPHQPAKDLPEPFGLTAVACICAAGLAAFQPPETVRRIYIAEDDDETGRRAAAVLADRVAGRGIQVRILRGIRR